MHTTSSRTDVLRDSPRMFESDLLDRLSRVHPSVPLVLFVPAIGVLAAAAASHLTAGPALAWLAGGWLFWSLFEYWMHRLVFHFEPEHGLGARLHFIIHGVHHDHPNDPMRLVMPPSVSVPLAALFVGAFVLVLGPAGVAFGAGFLLGYLLYDMTHYHLHHHLPRTRLGRLLREQHMRHHFQDETRGYGVSMPVWDYAFGTAPRRRAQPGDGS
jgi:sterol desaturase/sphingolipid hydroxylase (fatty acid hydroxylase superfamily)